eukprot:PhM_4_TR1319/c0_g1_i1/m.52925
MFVELGRNAVRRGLDGLLFIFIVLVMIEASCDVPTGKVLRVLNLELKISLKSAPKRALRAWGNGRGPTHHHHCRGRRCRHCAIELTLSSASGYNGPRVLLLCRSSAGLFFTFLSIILYFLAYDRIVGSRCCRCCPFILLVLGILIVILIVLCDLLSHAFRLFLWIWILVDRWLLLFLLFCWCGISLLRHSKIKPLLPLKHTVYKNNRCRLFNDTILLRMSTRTTGRQRGERCGLSQQRVVKNTAAALAILPLPGPLFLLLFMSPLQRNLHCRRKLLDVPGVRTANVRPLSEFDLQRGAV